MDKLVTSSIPAPEVKGGYKARFVQHLASYEPKRELVSLIALLKDRSHKLRTKLQSAPLRANISFARSFLTNFTESVVQLSTKLTFRSFA